MKISASLRPPGSLYYCLAESLNFIKILPEM
jgi:hypothetical protein